MKVWIARDKYGLLALYYSKPTRVTGHDEDDLGVHTFGYFKDDRIGYLNKGDFPEVTWENSPQQVELKLIEDENRINS